MIEFCYPNTLDVVE